MMKSHLNFTKSNSNHLFSIILFYSPLLKQKVQDKQESIWNLLENIIPNTYVICHKRHGDDAWNQSNI